MSIATAVVGALVVGVAAFLVYVASKPDEFRIERTQRIEARQQAVFDKVNDLRAFNTWNPFAADPTLKIAYSGSNAGVGAGYSWDSSGKAGAGSLTILASKPSSEVSMRLEFRRPFVAENRADFQLLPDGDATRVVWSMTGRNTYLQKLMGTVFNMDRMVGGEFVKGLSTLKSQFEH